VTLFERGAELGGTLRLAATLEPARELLGSITWLAAQLDILGVDLNLGREVTAAEVLALEPDVVVVATGVTYPPLALPSRVPADGTVRLRYPEEMLEGGPASGRYCLVDWLGGPQMAAAAEYLALRGASVTVVAPAPTIGRSVGFTAQVELGPRLWEAGCTLLPNTDLAAIEDGVVTLVHVQSGEIRREQFDVLVLGVRGAPALGIAEELGAAGVTVRLAGDVVAPRTALHAFREGEDAARQL
jgi:NADPH-dependent 2,4-dienoyl-CoA reductase/sulfur reductase-like enzyme